MVDGASSALWLGWVGLVVLPLTVLFFVLSAMLERSGPIRLRHWAEEAGGRLRSIFENPVRFEAFRFLLSALAKLAPLVLYLSLRVLLEALRVPRAGLVALACVAVVVAATEFINRLLVGHDPEEGLRRLTRVYRAVLFLLLPVVAAVAPLLPARTVERRQEPEDEEASEDEIEAFIDFGQREGILEPAEGELVRGIVDFGETQVRSVMTPRIDMVCAATSSSLEELAEICVESKHSRIPVFEESIDEIGGVLHIRDVLSALRSSAPPAVEEMAKPAIFVPETKPLDELFKDLQASQQQLAIVVDEYGGTAGLVTMEDLLEEIVGEIVDEHEEREPEPEPQEDGAFRLDGRSHLEVLSELFGIGVNGLPYETVGGMIFGLLGHVAEEGEVVEAHGLRFVVEKVAERRIQSVHVERLTGAREEEGGSQP
jgi:putative hemolysin